MSNLESMILMKLHTRFIILNPWTDLVEREITCWTYFAPILLHHFSASASNYPKYENSKRVKLAIGFYLRSITSCNRLSQVGLIEIMKSVGDKVDEIEITGKNGGTEFKKMKEELNGW